MLRPAVDQFTTVDPDSRPKYLPVIQTQDNNEGSSRAPCIGGAMTTTQLLNEIRSTDVPNVAPGLSQLVVLVVWQLAAAGLIVAQTPSAVANPARSFPPPSAFDLSNPAFRATEQPSRDRLLYLGLTGIPPLTSSASPPISQTRRAPQYQGAFANTSTWLRDLTLESFGIGLGTGALMTGIDRSPGYFVSLFDHHGMECPGCAVGP